MAKDDEVRQEKARIPLQSPLLLLILNRNNNIVPFSVQCAASKHNYFTIITFIYVLTANLRNTTCITIAVKSLIGAAWAAAGVSKNIVYGR